MSFGGSKQTVSQRVFVAFFIKLVDKKENKNNVSSVVNPASGMDVSKGFFKKESLVKYGVV